VKIGLDVTPAIRETAGVGRYTRELMSALLRRGGHTYSLFCLGRECGPGVFPAAGTPPAPVYHLPVPERWATIAWHRARLPVPIDVILGRHDLWHFPSFVVPPVRRGTVFLTVHDLSYRLLPETAAPGLRSYLERTVPRSICRADLVIADSESTRRDVERELGVPGGKISVILSGVDARFASPVDRVSLTALRDRLCVHAPYVLAVGTLQPRKNYERLIAAFANIARSGFPHHLVIAGRKGWLYGGIARQITALGIEERVHVVEFIADEDLPALYTAADLFVYPSLYEGFGIPPLEAMACGTPVVASNVSSVPESVGSAGILVDPYNIDAMSDAMCLVLTDRGRRDALIRAGKARAALFTWDAAAERLASLYDQFAPDPHARNAS